MCYNYYFMSTMLSVRADQHQDKTGQSTLDVTNHENGTPVQKQIRLKQVFISTRQSPTGAFWEDTGNNT